MINMSRHDMAHRGQNIGNFYHNKNQFFVRLLQYITFAKQINKLIVVTRGEKGATAINGNEIVECGIKENLKIVDLTGAGDLFAAGFLHGYVNKLSIKESLEKGTDMSSKIIQQIGARMS